MIKQQTFRQKVADEFMKLIGSDEDDYKYPDWQIPRTAEMSIAHAEGWDDCKKALRNKVNEWKK
jgi:hypothetical protein